MKNLLQTWTWVFISVLHTNEAIMGASVVYVPEEHFLFLACRRGSDVEWTHEIVRINATKHMSSESRLDWSKYQLLPDGTLYIRKLEKSDRGRYYCNGQLVAEVIILTGESFVVSEGSTLYLPCSFSGKLKQRWAYKHTAASKREYISTMLKNGTVTQEREDPDSRFFHSYNHLHINNLQLSDSGIYLCNGHEVANVMVIHTESETFQTATTDSTEVENNVPYMPENATLVLFLAFTVLAVVVVTLLSVILCLRFRSRRKDPAPRQEDTELQLQKTSARVLAGPKRSPGDEEHSVPLTNHCEIQYASLGRQNWRARGWTQNSGQQVIYSTLLHGPTSPLPTSSITQRL
ncbi:uncharacterized protein LOC108413609 [Pygocentrus nattereri]|uniref:uncharacterized protein LOC108413609 n=1 Tax=Pygocentrus nattereri TaxID=42514 RepID=UPI0008144682|nr:uncharacterized protein LOC108413609 [Pygocentrus nattereri]